MPTQLSEATVLGEANQVSSGRLQVQIITPGLGSSGYYSPEVLERAARDGLAPRGTHMFLDHAGQHDRANRPERSVRDIAAVLTEDARWDGQALVATAQVLAPYRDLLNELAQHELAVSISGSATDIVTREVGGQRVPAVEGIARIDSIDFVTRAGRGGRATVLVESARDRTDDQVQHDISEALAATPTTSGPTPALNPTPEPGGPMTAITEAGERELRESVRTAEAARDIALSERDTAVTERNSATQRAETAERALAESRARDAARPIITTVLAEGSAPLSPLTSTRVTETLLAQVPLTDTGALDETALRTTTTAARDAAIAEAAQIAEASGAGLPRTLGVHTAGTDLTEAAKLEEAEAHKQDLARRRAGLTSKEA